MNTGIVYATSISALYTAIIFLVAWYAHHRKEIGRSIVSNPIVYSLSIAVYCTSWTFYGSVGKASTTGIDFLMIYLGPSLAAFSWLFLLRRIVKISKENNITSIADFISLRYGKSLWLGALVTIIAVLGIMPYIALQIKAVSHSFFLVSGLQADDIPLTRLGSGAKLPTGLILAVILSIFSIIFGARKLVSSDRHEGLVAAVAFESLIKLISLLGVGIFVTYFLFDGVTDIFTRFKAFDPAAFDRLFTFDTSSRNTDSIPTFTMLFLSMGAIMLLPRQFHVMVIENSDEKHISTAMWLFPAYLFLINLFVMPIALGGILTTGSNQGADFFVISIPLVTGNSAIAQLAFLGGLSAAAGMVMVESVAISTMLLNHIFMPIIVRCTPRVWFPVLLINLKRFGIFLVIMMGYFYHRIVGDSYMLVNMGLISFSAAAQFMPAMLGGLYWRRGNKAGAIGGILLGFMIWFYTLLLPSFSRSGWLPADLLTEGPFGITLLRPTALFGLSGMDLWSHSLFWSMLFNISIYITCSLMLKQTDNERDQVSKYIAVFERERGYRQTEQKRLSKPVTKAQFVTLMAKFIGETEAQNAISLYANNRELNSDGAVSEFELPNLKRHTEKTLAGSVGAAAAGAIVDSFLSDMGSRMESVYDIYSTVRASLDQSRESLFVRLKASEIINRTLDLQIIMDDLLNLLLKEFKLDAAIIQLKNENGSISVTSYQGSNRRLINENHWYTESAPYIDMAYHDRNAHFTNDARLAGNTLSLERTLAEGIISFAHIPILREGEQAVGILSVFSKSIAGLFTQEFINLLSSLCGQLAQAITIVHEMHAKDRERDQKERALLQNARVMRDMEIAQQIQISLLPDNAPEIFGVELAGKCISAAHVGGDYYDFFLRNENTVDLMIADVSGHSVGAALIMAEVRTLLRAQVNSAYSASSILNILNSQLHDDLTRAELFISMFYAKYNSASGKLSYSNAGHNHPIIHRSGSSACIELDTEGLIIGVKPSVIFEERNIELVSGDVLLLYTDGLTEAFNSEGEMFGNEKVCAHLGSVAHLSAREIIDSIFDAASAFTGSRTFQDDISLVVLKIN
ncbi:MAG: stage II sporulation protein E [Geobacteraceae bacterium GWC2_55_20]|nr:MAG: stage II sporulation protein E [Geobacteraceae bacterium GWC2_55_20]OGU19876.1 MAG: stage II sporulation protein E [Geobacteraceae bacterium GWF2_54_21]HCE67131.1 stage II sporulation protein E [Geobacter sp.]